MFRSKAEDEQKQKAFGEGLTKAIRIKDEGSRKTAVFSAIDDYLKA